MITVWPAVDVTKNGSIEDLPASIKAPFNEVLLAIRAVDSVRDQTQAEIAAKAAVEKKKQEAKLAKEKQLKDDKLAKERIQLVDLAQNLAVHPYSAALVEPLVRPSFESVQTRQAALDASRRRPLPGLGNPRAPGGVQ